MIERVLTKHNPICKIKNRTLPRATPVVWWWAEAVTVMAELVVAPLRLSLTSHLSNGYSDLPSLYLSSSLLLYRLIPNIWPCLKFVYMVNLILACLFFFFFFFKPSYEWLGWRRVVNWVVGVEEQPYLASFHQGD